MSSEEVEGLIRALRGEPSGIHVGIGIGNLYKRLTTLYGEDAMKIRKKDDQ